MLAALCNDLASSDNLARDVLEPGSGDPARCMLGVRLDEGLEERSGALDVAAADSVEPSPGNAVTHPISASVLRICELRPVKYPFGSIVLEPDTESVICSSLIESIFSRACPISAKSVIAFAGVSWPAA